MTTLVTGAGGAIGSALCSALQSEGADIKPLVDWLRSPSHRIGLFGRCDLSASIASAIVSGQDRVFHLAADMGGMGYIGHRSGDKAAMLTNSRIDLNVMQAAAEAGVKRFVYASSACVYNEHVQGPDATPLIESDAWPAQPDTMYGLEKLFGEKVLESLKSDTFSPLAVRLHNVYGPHSTWRGGREKAPAALCRKVAEAKRDKSRKIEIWGDGEQVRSYLYIDDCVTGLIKLAATERTTPINLGSDRGVSVNELVDIIEKIADWPCVHYHVKGPQGVRSRNADLTQLRTTLDGWEPPTSLEDGIRALYSWIEALVMEGK